MDLRRVEAFAHAHHGLVSQTRAIEMGISRSAWYRGIDAHVFERIGPGVVRLIGAPPTKHQRILAAAWSVGPDAVASHRPGAFLWGAVRPENDPIDVILPSRNRTRMVLDGVVVHRPRDQRDLVPVMRDGIPCVNPMRVLVDLGAVDPDGVLDALEDMLVARVISMTTVHASLARHARKGHHGIGALRAAVEESALDARPPDSRLETVMARLLRDARLPNAEFHARVLGYEVDFLFANSKVVVECDSHRFHGLDRNQFEFDRRRDAELTAAGYIVVHVTWRQVTRHPADVAGRLRSNLRQWAPHLLQRPVA